MIAVFFFYPGLGIFLTRLLLEIEVSKWHSLIKENLQNYFNKICKGLQYNNFVISPFNYIKSKNLRNTRNSYMFFSSARLGQKSFTDM